MTLPLSAGTCRSPRRLSHMKGRLLAVALSVIVAACGTVAGPGSDPSPTPESSVTVTKADNQRTVRAHVGDHIQVALGEDINWQLEPPTARCSSKNRIATTCSCGGRRRSGS